MIKAFVSMLIIDKIFEESRIFIIMSQHNALIGMLMISLLIMNKVLKIISFFHLFFFFPQ